MSGLTHPSCPSNMPEYPHVFDRKYIKIVQIFEKLIEILCGMPWEGHARHFSGAPIRKGRTVRDLLALRRRIVETDGRSDLQKKIF